MARYSEKLKDPRWQKKRLEIFERDGWSCTNCGDKESPLAVHHLSYEKGKDPWDYKSEWLTTLCEPCHGIEFHHREDAEKKLTETLRSCGFSHTDLRLIAWCMEELVFRNETDGKKYTTKDLVLYLLIMQYPKTDVSHLKDYIDIKYPNKVKKYFGMST